MNTHVQKQLITITEFLHMAGRKHRSWYSRHIKDPGMPQRLYGPTGEVMLDYRECLAYCAQYRPRKAG